MPNHIVLCIVCSFLIYKSEIARLVAKTCFHFLFDNCKQTTTADKSNRLSEFNKMSHTPSRKIKLEVCVDSIASAIAAAEGGASRIELCSALTEGGLTPTVGVLKVLKDLLNVDIYCMLRPRRGNDFVFSDKEIDGILFDMELLREHGADGFVFGALTKERKIDTKICQRIVEKAKDLPLTFHRAFDLTNPVEMHENVAILQEHGFKRILTSGFHQTALDGIEYLAQLIAKHHGNIQIMPGAGINVRNLEEILTTTKCQEFHSSAKKMPDSIENSARMEIDNVTMGKQDSDPYLITDVNVVRKMVSIAQSMAGIDV